MHRIATLVYGIGAYLGFFGVSLYAVGFVGGFLTPTSLDGPPTGSLGAAVTVDAALLAAFALQHSIMARPAFKRWWIRFVPQPVERSTYVMASNLVLIVLFAAWRPIGGVLWSTAGVARFAVIGVYLLGWAVLFYATWLIDHFDLFGLAQVWRRFANQTYVAPKFHTPGLYRIVRHPIYVGWLMIFWAAPTMTVAHLLFALATTAYILGAIQLEERDLLAAFGGEYAEYRRRTPMLIPRIGAKSRSLGAPTPVSSFMKDQRP